MTITKEEIFTLRQSDLKDELKRELKAMKYKVTDRDGYLYAPGKVPVLLVAHLDTVHRKAPRIQTSGNGDVWFADEGIGGDDRCGVYMVLQVAARHKCHVLFTEDEECGAIGAGKFAKSGLTPMVNCIIEFDRKGSDDAVFYDCANEEFEQFVVDHGFKTNYGSFSDISVIAPKIEVAAVNLSSGYYNPHTDYEFVVWSDMENNINKACAMIADCKKQYDYIPARFVYDDWGCGMGPYYDAYLNEDEVDTILETVYDELSTGNYAKAYEELTEYEIDDILYECAGASDPWMIREVLDYYVGHHKPVEEAM